MERCFQLPQAGKSEGRKNIWIITDAVGVLMLQGLQSADLRNRGQHLYFNYNVLIQEGIRDFFESMHAEMLLMLELEDALPDLIVVHAGHAYVGNPSYTRKELIAKVISEMEKTREGMRKSDRVVEQQADVPIIWSRMVTILLQNEHFTEKAIYNTFKVVNSEAAATLFDMGFGIIKHSSIEPNEKMFDPSGRPTPEAKLRFLSDVSNHVRERDQVQAADEVRRRKEKWVDNTQGLKLKEAQDRQKKLSSKLDDLERQVNELKRKNNTPPKRDHDERFKQRCREDNRKKKPFPREDKHRPRRQQGKSFHQRFQTEREQFYCNRDQEREEFLRFLKFQEFERREKDEHAFGARASARRRLDY